MAAFFPEELGGPLGKASDDSCYTCFCPSLDRPDTKNMFASVGFSDAALGRKQAAWRLEISAGEASPSADTPELGCSPGSMDAELARLLEDDDDQDLSLGVPETPIAPMADSLASAAGAAIRTVVPGAIAREEPDLLCGSLLGDNNNTCTTCWNLNAALAERKVRGDYELPDTAMGLGSSRMMSTEERAFVGKLMDGHDHDEPLEGLSRVAAQLGGLDLPSPAASGNTSDESGSTQLGEDVFSEADSGSLSSSGMARVRADKRSAETSAMDDSVSQASMESKRPRRAAADRATRLARIAIQDQRGAADDNVYCSQDSSSTDARHAVAQPAPAARSSSVARSRGGSSCKGRQLPDWSVHILKEWLLSPEHFDYPWPTPEEKADLAARAGVDERQLGIWLTNARKRLWMPLRRRQGLPIPRYADAKAERVQRALVARVEGQVKREHQAPEHCPAPAKVDPEGASRVVAALHAAHMQLRAEVAALANEASAVEARAAILEQAVAAPPAPFPVASYGPSRLVPVASGGAALPVSFLPQNQDWDLGFGLPEDDDLPLGLA